MSANVAITGRRVIAFIAEKSDWFVGSCSISTLSGKSCFHFSPDSPVLALSPLLLSVSTLSTLTRSHQDALHFLSNSVETFMAVTFLCLGIKQIGKIRLCSLFIRFFFFSFRQFIVQIHGDEYSTVTLFLSPALYEKITILLYYKPFIFFLIFFIKVSSTGCLKHIRNEALIKSRKWLGWNEVLICVNSYFRNVLRWTV